MKKLLAFLYQDQLYCCGLILIVLSALNLHLEHELFSERSPGSFFICYAFSVAYMIATNRKSLNTRC